MTFLQKYGILLFVEKQFSWIEKIGRIVAKAMGTERKFCPSSFLSFL